MDDLQFYVAKFVVKNQDLWTDPKDYDSFIEVKESYQVHDLLFLARDNEEAFTLATSFIETFRNVHHDGPGDMFKSEGIGIHQLYATLISRDRLIEILSIEDSLDLGSINIDDLTSNNNTPRIRKKEELDLFKN